MTDTFIGEISQHHVQPYREDNWIWKHDQSGNYSTKSGYDLIWRELMGANQNSDFADLWKLKIPAKAAMFAWRLIRDRLPKKMNLRRRQVMVNDFMCPLCGLKEEEIAHLFFSCSNTLPLWWESLSWVIATALPQNPRDHYLQHATRTAEGKKLTRWKCWWIALTWTIWNHRNKIVFQNHTFDGRKLLDDAILLLWTWVKSMEKDFDIHFNQWSMLTAHIYTRFAPSSKFLGFSNHFQYLITPSFSLTPKLSSSISANMSTFSTKNDTVIHKTQQPLQIAKRLEKFQTTIFTQMRLLAIKHGAINLGQGFPNFDGPKFVKEAAIQAIRDGKNQYAQGYGVADLNIAIANRFKKDTGLVAHAFLTFTIAHPFQCAAAAALRAPDSYYVELKRDYMAKRAILVEGRWLQVKEVGVVAIPTSVFYFNPEEGKNLIRFTFCKDDETIRRFVKLPVRRPKARRRITAATLLRDGTQVTARATSLCVLTARARLHTKDVGETARFRGSVRARCLR
ncbi:Methionine aminotransferase [Glycine soja]